MENGAKVELECSLNSFGVMKFRINNDTITFEEFSFRPNKWVFVTLSHVYSKISSKNLKLYVNGVIRSEATLVFPKSIASKVNARFGSEADSRNKAKSDQNIIWQLGHFTFFEDLLSEKEVFLNYIHGPNYIGEFEGTDPQCITSFVEDYTTESFVRAQEDLLELFWKGSFEFYESLRIGLREKILFALNVKSMTFAIRKNSYSSATPTPSLSVATMTIPVKVMFYKGETQPGKGPKDFKVTCFARHSVKQILANAGGMSLIVYMLTMMTVCSKNRIEYVSNLNNNVQDLRYYEM
jgi:hypothetical protein